MAEFSGTIDESLKKWIMKTARRNLWRVARWYEIEDLVGDGMMIAAKISRQYAPANQRHYMALVMTAYNNHVESLARKRRRGDDVLAADMAPTGVDFDWWLSALMGHAHSDAALSRLLSKARFPVDEVISLFLTDRGVAELRRRPQRPRETPNRYICRLLGVDHDEYDVPALVESFLRGSGLYFLRQPVPAIG